MPKSPLYLKPGSKIVEICADIAVIMTRPGPKHLFENSVCRGRGLGLPRLFLAAAVRKVHGHYSNAGLLFSVKFSIQTSTYKDVL